MAGFYDDLAAYYHLVYPDWDDAIGRQAEALDRIIRGAGVPPASRVLDVACGIGTQSLGLARLGYAVTASDLSAGAVARARREAAARGLALELSVADMRSAFDAHGGGFDVVLACDNSVPHLLSDEEIRGAFTQFFRCTRPGGICLLSVRDYEALPTGGTQLHPYGVRDLEGRRVVLLQLWEFRGDIYDLTLYVVEDEGEAACRTRALRTRYYAVRIGRLLELLREAGYEGVRRIDDSFFQPVIVGRRPAR